MTPETLEAKAERLGIRLGSEEVLGSPQVPARSTSPRPRRSSGNPIGRPRQDTCINGHDLNVTRILVNGKAHGCRECRHTGKPKGRPKQRHCLRGHDTDACGRYGNGTCRECYVKVLGPRRRQETQAMIDRLRARITKLEGMVDALDVPEERA